MSRRDSFNSVDRLVRWLRTRSADRHVPSGSRVLDVGCGLENWLIKTMTLGATPTWAPTSIGIDPDLQVEDGRGQRCDVTAIAEQLPGEFDVAISLAVIEHLPPDEVSKHLASIRATLRPGGRIVLTTPTPRARPILEFLAFRLHVISEFEIRDHRRYYNGTELRSLLTRAGFVRVEHTTFQFGLNQRVVAHRSDDPNEESTP